MKTIELLLSCQWTIMVKLCDGKKSLLRNVVNIVGGCMHTSTYLCNKKSCTILTSDLSRFIHSKIAATRPLPIERAYKTELMAVLAVYQQQYSNTNKSYYLIPPSHLWGSGNKNTGGCKIFNRPKFIPFGPLVI